MIKMAELNTKNFFENKINWKNFDPSGFVCKYSLLELLEYVTKISSDLVLEIVYDAFHPQENSNYNIKTKEDYYSDIVQGSVNTKNGYSRENVKQAKEIQTLLCEVCELFKQSVIDKRIFDESYLKSFSKSLYIDNEIEGLKKIVRSLEQENTFLKKVILKEETDWRKKIHNINQGGNND